jgi:hypothetical protein
MASVIDFLEDHARGFYAFLWGQLSVDNDIILYNPL